MTYYQLTTWAILSFFMPSTMWNNLDINIFTFAGIVFILSYGIFALTQYFNTSMWELPILVSSVINATNGAAIDVISPKSPKAAIVSECIKKVIEVN